MTGRPERLWDQYVGKAHAEALRGAGWWPLQPHPCSLEPPFDEFDRNDVSMWDCMVNGWEGAWAGGLLQQLTGVSGPVIDGTRPIVLPKAPPPASSELRPIVIEQFPEDSSTIPKADQLLRSLPHLRHPASFEILGIGPQAQWDNDLAADILGARAAGQNRELSEAITGWTRPVTRAQFVVHERDVAPLNRLLLAHYPNSAVVLRDELESAEDNEAGRNVIHGEGYAAALALHGPWCWALRTFNHLDPDPLGVAIAAMEDLDREEWAILQIVFQRTTYPWAEMLEYALQNPYRDEFLLEDISPRDLALKFCGPLFAVSVRFAASRRDVFQQLYGWAEQFTSDQQRLVYNDAEWDEDGGVPEHEFTSLGESIEHRTAYRPGMLLNANELASLVHLPSQAVVSERLASIRRRTRPAIDTPDQDGSILIGENMHRGQKRLARIPSRLRERHCYVAGASGTGKSTLLLNMVLQDIKAGHGAGVLDPHGDLVHAILQRIPEDRIDDVVLFDPSDEQFPFALNILESRDSSERERIVAEMLMALERYFPASWGPRLERILTFTLYTVLDAVPNATLDDVERMLIDFRFREAVIERCSVERYVQFWDNEFSHMPKNAADPVLNKLSVFLLNPTVRNIICQRRAAVDFDEVLNSGKIFLANLSTGVLSEKIANTFGSFLVTKIVNAAFRRARLPHDRRKPWYLYVDEFQAFMNLSVGFERILAEARKYRLVLTMANQYVGQLTGDVRQAVFGNVGTMITFRLGVDDASRLSSEMGIFTAEEILSLAVGEAITRAGGSETAFNLKTFPESAPLDDDPTNRIVSQTHWRFAFPRADVEAEFTNERETQRDRQAPVPPVEKTPSSRSRRRNRSGSKKTRKADRAADPSPTPPPEPRDPNEDDLVI